MLLDIQITGCAKLSCLRGYGGAVEAAESAQDGARQTIWIVSVGTDAESSDLSHGPDTHVGAVAQFGVGVSTPIQRSDQFDGS